VPLDASAPSCLEPLDCDPRSGDGCLEAGSCSLVSEVSSCEMTPGALGPGATCENVTDCAPGLACFQSELGGICGRICCPGDDTCLEGNVCRGSGILVDETQTRWGQCLPPQSCDVLQPELDCSTREGCYIIDSGGNTECRVAGTGAFGDACTAQEDCQSGFFCGGVGGATHCARICRLGGEPCPIDEGRCVWQLHSPEGSGICTIDATTAQR
jgi:hypothetical protein